MQSSNVSHSHVSVTYAQKLFSSESGTPAQNSTPADFNPSTNFPTSTITHHHFKCAVRHLLQYVKNSTPAVFNPSTNFSMPQSWEWRRETLDMTCFPASDVLLYAAEVDVERVERGEERAH